LPPLPFPLVDKKLGVGDEDLGDRFLELSAFFDPLADRLHPILGNAFDSLPSLDHEGEEPEGMSLGVAAMTVGFAATAMGEGQRTGEAVGGEAQASQQAPVALAEAPNGRVFSRWACHI